MARIGRMYHPAPLRFCLIVLNARVACFVYRKRRSTAYASTTPSPALVNGNGPTTPRGRLRAGDPSTAAVGGHVSLGRARGWGGPALGPALSAPDGPRPGASRNAGAVGFGITQTRTALLR